MKESISNFIDLSDLAKSVFVEIEKGSESNPTTIQAIKDKIGCSDADIWDAIIEMMMSGLWIQATYAKDALWENTCEVSDNSMSDYLYRVMVDLARAIMGMDHVFELQEYAPEIVASIFDYGERFRELAEKKHK